MRGIHKNEEMRWQTTAKSGDWRRKIKLHTSGAFTGHGFSGGFCEGFSGRLNASLTWRDL
jgi:hypothetical protein